MKAIIYHHFGGPEVLQLSEVPMPVARPGEVLVKVKAAGLNPKDTRVRLGRLSLLSGSRFPKMLGYDFSGVVHGIPKGTETNLRIGDPVYGMKNGFAGGTVAEFVAVSAQELAPLPVGLSWEEAASLPLAAMTALQALRPALSRVQGRLPQVLLHGASGGVGVYAIQLAKLLGAEVTTTSSQINLEHCRQLGADFTLDYRQESGLEVTERWDLVFDIFGNRSFWLARSALRSDGTYLTTVPSLAIGLDWLKTLWARKRARMVIVKNRRQDLEFISQAIVAGQLRAVLDKVFPIEATTEAQAYIESKRARGKVVIRL